MSLAFEIYAATILFLIFGALSLIAQSLKKISEVLLLAYFDWKNR